MSRRTLGERADLTPQLARIDADSLVQEGITRLCYAGSTLHTRAKSPMASRSPIQLGAELYGDDSLAADVEVIRLMLATLDAAGVGELDGGITLDLGHVGVYEAVLDAADLTDTQEQQVFDALQRKSVPDLTEILDGLPATTGEMILALVDLHGDDSVLARAREVFAEQAPDALAAVDALQQVASDIRSQRPGIEIYFDLAELRGYHYHTGIVFAAYVGGHGQAVANGGRYNNVGEVFGRARPATGFATDLKAMVSLLPADIGESAGAISMPDANDPELEAEVARLRAAGEVVVNSLSTDPDPRCDRELVEQDGNWVLRALND